jgi:hypothetical protein
VISPCLRSAEPQAKPGALVALGLGDVRLCSDRVLINIVRGGRERRLVIHAVPSSDLCTPCIAAISRNLGQGTFSGPLAAEPLFRTGKCNGKLTGERLSVQAVGYIIKRSCFRRRKALLPWLVARSILVASGTCRWRVDQISVPSLRRSVTETPLLSLD